MTELVNILATQAGEQTAAAGGAAGFLGNPIFMFVLMFLVIYLLMIRPQQKKAKEHKSFLDNLNRGDQVITSSGILGRIVDLHENIVVLEIAKDTRIQLLRSQISGPQQTKNGAADNNGKKGKAA